MNLNLQKYHFIDFIICFFLAMIPSFLSYPKGFDIVRFYKYYDHFEVFGYQYMDTLFDKVPDYIFTHEIFVFSYFNIPLQVLIFINVLGSILMPLYVLRKFTTTSWHIFLLIICINLGGWFSGVRNVHAFSAFILSTYFYYDNKKWVAYTFYVYAVLFHYSLILFLPLFFLIHLDLKKILQLLYFAIIGLIAFYVFKPLVVHFIENLLPYCSLVLKKKIEFYLLTQDILFQNLENNPKGFVYAILIRLWILPAYYYVFKYSSKDIENLFYHKLLVIGLIIATLFFLFPTISFRFFFFVKIIFLFNILINKKIDTNFKYVVFLLFIISYIIELSIFIRALML